MFKKCCSCLPFFQNDEEKFQQKFGGSEIQRPNDNGHATNNFHSIAPQQSNTIPPPNTTHTKNTSTLETPSERATGAPAPVPQVAQTKPYPNNMEAPALAPLSSGAAPGERKLFKAAEASSGRDIDTSEQQKQQSRQHSMQQQVPSVQPPPRALTPQLQQKQEDTGHARDPIKIPTVPPAAMFRPSVAEPATPALKSSHNYIYSPDSIQNSPLPMGRMGGTYLPPSVPHADHEKQAGTRVEYFKVLDSGRQAQDTPVSFGETHCRSNQAPTVEDAGSCSIAGTAKGMAKPNQDRASLCQSVLPCGVMGPAAVDVFAVFDGIGPLGHMVAQSLHDALEKTLKQHVTYGAEPLGGLLQTFASLDRVCIDGLPKSESQGESGATATIALVLDAHLVVANVGDSRCVLGMKSSGRYVAVDLSEDHKPGLDRERLRVRGAGGDVRCAAPTSGNHSAFMTPSRGMHHGSAPGTPLLGLRAPGHKDQGAYKVVAIGAADDEEGMPVSRALGCWKSRNIGVSCTPDLYVRELRPGDRFLLLCTDAVWQYFTSDEAVQYISGYQEAGEASRSLANEARRRCQAAAEKRSKTQLGMPGNLTPKSTMSTKADPETIDDVTAVVVFLTPILPEDEPDIRPINIFGKEVVGKRPPLHPRAGAGAGASVAPPPRPTDSKSDTVTHNFQVWFESQVAQQKAQEDMRKLYSKVLVETEDDAPSASASHSGLPLQNGAPSRPSHQLQLPDPDKGNNSPMYIL